MTVPNNDKYAGPWVLPVGRWANVRVKNLNGTTFGTLVTSAPSGLYRVSMALAITTPGTAGQLTLSVGSIGDDGSTATQSLAGINITATGIVQDAFVCEVGTASNISYVVTAAGITAGSLQYSLRIVVEQLSALP